MLFRIEMPPWSAVLKSGSSLLLILKHPSNVISFLLDNPNLDTVPLTTIAACEATILEIIGF